MFLLEFTHVLGRGVDPGYEVVTRKAILQILLGKAGTHDTDIISIAREFDLKYK